VVLGDPTKTFKKVRIIMKGIVEVFIGGIDRTIREETKRFVGFVVS